MAVFTAVLTRVSLQTLPLLKQQLTDAKQATIDATQNQVRSQMPVVFPVTVDGPRKVMKDGKPNIHFNIRLQNFGQTEAVSPVFEWGWGDKIPDAATKYQSGWIYSWSKSMWTPSIFGDNAQDISITKDESTPDHPFYIYGVVEYVDIFRKDASGVHKGRNDHRVQWIFNVTDIKIGDKEVTWEIKVAPEGSCLDEQCDAYADHEYYPGRPN